MAHLKREKPLKLRQARHWPAVAKGPDPLSRNKRSAGQTIGVWLGLLLGATVAHVGIAGAFIGAEKMFKSKAPLEKSENIKVAIIEEKQIPPAVDPEPVLDDIKEAPPSKPEPLPKPKVKKLKQPKADPINKQEQPAKPLEPNKPPPRKIVGLDFSSTVAGGKGPGFGTGNTRMGQTSGKAAKPKEVVSSSELPQEKVNKKAQYIPTAKSKLVKPKIKKRIKPKYPGLYNEQRLVALVVVEVDVSASGIVTSAKLLKKSEHEQFNVEALKAAKKQRFSPATKDGVPMAYRIQLPYRFEPPD